MLIYPDYKESVNQYVCEVYAKGKNAALEEADKWTALYAKLGKAYILFAI